MAEQKKFERSVLTGRAYYAFLNKPQKDRENDKEVYKLELVLTNEDGKPVVVLDKKTGQKINMLERAKDLNLIVKDEAKSVPGPHVRIKREKKTKDDGQGNVVITPAPEVKDKSGQSLGGKLVGNESLVQVEFTVIPIQKGNHKGKNSAYLNKVVVHKLVEYISPMNEAELEFDTDTLEAASKASPKKETVNLDNEDEILELE